MEIRRLEFSDKVSFLSVLSHLTEVGTYNTSTWETVFYSVSNNPLQRCLVAIVNKEVVGTVSGIVQQRFIGGGKRTGWVEDMVVHPNHRGKGISKSLMEAINEFFKKHACTKVLGACEFGMQDIYKSSGYKRPKEEILIRKDFA
ncbi:MAG TPA: GNAT family N-acetyltransferase [Candidatus Paceibacterota bacterium]